MKADMAPQRQILVIGAGASGLAALKCCKEEGLNVTCYERTKHFGGRWRYSEYYTPKQASVMRSTICVSSKEMEAFSDFPPPSGFPNYLHHKKMLVYLTSYAQKFDLLRHIQYRREVIRIMPSPEYSKNGKWSVTTTNNCNHSQETEEFDGVMVCTGRLSEPLIPNFPNEDSFNGILVHSQSLRTTAAFEDLKILVVGDGNSAVEAAIEMSTVAQQVYLSSRNGFWLFPKLGPKGLPYDMHLLRRDINFMKSLCSELVSRSVERYLESKINHEACSIKPTYRALDKPPTVNDDLPDKILTGRVTVKRKISTFVENGIIFENEGNITEVDAVILATGYTIKLPFIEQEEIYRDINGAFNLYKGVFSAKLEHPTLAFIGFVKSNGPQNPVSESQSRWAARVFAKKLNLPSQAVMDAYIASKFSKAGVSSEMVFNYIDYMDELAEEYGVKPNMSSLLFKDSRLFWACFTGPFLSYQYRLAGPNSNASNARNFILECEQRVKESFNTKSPSRWYMKQEH